MRLISSAAVIALTATLPTLALAQSGSLTVNSQSNIFGYGVSTPAPSGGGGGVNAPVITLDAGTGRSMTLLASGAATWGGGAPNGPDGGTFSSFTNISALGPISGYTGPLSGFLVGVFIEAGDISGLAAPAALSYPDATSYALASYAPALRQVFYIGDGLTGGGSGSAQVFHVPDGAGALVLGLADAFSFNGQAGWYGDNVGSFTVDYQAAPVPEPSVASLFALGAALMAAPALRRRKKA